MTRITVYERTSQGKASLVAEGESPLPATKLLPFLAYHRRAFRLVVIERV